MPLPRLYFDVLLEDPETKAETEYRVEVRGADQLRAEMEAKKIPKVSASDGMHGTYLWCWAAAVREDRFSGTFGEFMRHVVQVRGDKAATTTVDPTQPETSDESV